MQCRAWYWKAETYTACCMKMLSHQSASTSLYTTTASRLSIRQGLQNESKIFNNKLSFASVSLNTNPFSNIGVGNVCIFIYRNIGFVHPRPDEQTKCQTYFFPCKQFIIIVKNIISHQETAVCNQADHEIQVSPFVTSQQLSTHPNTHMPRVVTNRVSRHHLTMPIADHLLLNYQQLL